MNMNYPEVLKTKKSFKKSLNPIFSNEDKFQISSLSSSNICNLPLDLNPDSVIYAGFIVHYALATCWPCLRGYINSGDKQSFLCAKQEKFKTVYLIWQYW